MTKPKTNEELRARLRKKAPEVLDTEMDFDSVIMRMFKSTLRTRKKKVKSEPFKLQKKQKKKSNLRGEG